MSRSWFISGQWNAVCDVCGFKRKASQIIDRWDGLKVCSPTVKQGCWEIRHPQEMIRPIPDQQALPWTRPEGTDIFVDQSFLTSDCSETGIYSQADYGEADCMTADLINGGLLI